MSMNWGRGAGQLKAQVDDRIGKFRAVEDTHSRQETFDLELNAFETGCMMRWLERRWSRPADMAGSNFIFHNNTLHIQMSQSMTGTGVPVSFEVWMRRLARMADQ